MPVYPAGVTTHAALTDVSTPHLLADLEAAVCSETEAATIAAAAAKKIATGSYTGNGANDRQITTGFKCSRVLILETATITFCYHYVPGATLAVRDGSDSNTDLIIGHIIHATDGFTVSPAGSVGANQSGKTYYYWAISE